MLNDTLTRTLSALARATSGAAAPGDASFTSVLAGVLAGVPTGALVDEDVDFRAPASPSSVWSRETGEFFGTESGNQSTLCISHDGKRRRSPGWGT